MIKQQKPISPPIETDKKLVDYSSIVQDNLRVLFQLGHAHVGSNGVLTAAPTSNQGSIGDIVIAVVSGSAYIYFKTSATQWYRLGPATAI